MKPYRGEKEREIMLDTIYNSDCINFLLDLPDNSVDCCVTSPPYYGLRDYNVTGQIGLEETPEKYISRLVSVFQEVRRVLKPEGTLWVNIGDSYAGSSKGAWKNKTAQKEIYVPDHGSAIARMPNVWEGIKPKDLIGIPWMLAFALRHAGWYLRQDIIWEKSNCMPESVKDRCVKSHEYIFLFSKSSKYYFDSEAIKQQAKPSTMKRVSQDLEHQTGYTRSLKKNGTMKAVIGGRKRANQNGILDDSNPMFRSNTDREYEYTDYANKRSVWTVSTAHCKEMHFAVFPEKLIVDCIKAGCPEHGIVLDPFMGSGTTAVVAKKLNRHYLGSELNPDYIRIAEKRLIYYKTQQTMF